MRGTIKGLLLAEGATFDSFALAVTVIFVLLAVIIEWPLTVVVILIWVTVAIALHGRRGLGLLELSEDGAQIDIGRLLSWLVVGSTRLIELVDGRHGGIVVEPRGRRLSCQRLRLHLKGLLLEIGKLGKDCFQTIRTCWRRMLLHLLLWRLTLLWLE